MTMRKSNQFKEYLKTSFIRYSILMIAVIFALFFIMLFFVYEETVVRANKKTNDQIKSALEANFKTIEYDMLTLSRNAKVMESILFDRNKLNLNQYLYDYVNSTSYTEYFLLVDNEGHPIATNLYTPNVNRLKDNIQLKKLLKQTTNQQDTVVQQMNPLVFESGQASEYVISKAIIMNGQVIGTLFLYIQSMYELMGDIAADQVILTDRFDRIIYSTFSEAFVVLDKFKYDTSKHQIQVIANSPFHSVRQVVQSNQIQVLTFNSVAIFKKFIYLGSMLFIALFIVLVGIILYAVPKISNRVMAPLNALLAAFTTFSGKNIKPALHEETFDEFQTVLDEFHLLTNKMEDLIERNEKIAENKRQLEIKHLENQFNPHFVFNTLETLRYEMAFNQENAENMIVALANLMRYSINQGPSEVLLKTELRYVEDYLLIQKVRFGERLQYQIQTDALYGECEIPKLILQNLVENAIKHCMEQTLSLTITIKASIEDDMLVLQVLDNGQGISQDKLIQIEAALQQDTQPNENIGLFNTNKIIELLYGSSFRMELLSEVNVGTAIILRLPVKRGILHV